MKEKYIRIGTQLYKVVRRPLISGDFIEEKVQWSYETLRQDYGKNNLPEIEKYDGFCSIPDHVNYQRVHGTSTSRFRIGRSRANFPISGHFWPIFSARRSNWGMTTCNCF